MEQSRHLANVEVLKRLNDADPVLVDVAPAGEVIPGMTANKILTSGAPLNWSDYLGGQRNALIYGAIYEGLANDAEDS